MTDIYSYLDGIIFLHYVFEDFRKNNGHFDGWSILYKNWIKFIGDFPFCYEPLQIARQTDEHKCKNFNIDKGWMKKKVTKNTKRQKKKKNKTKNKKKKSTHTHKSKNKQKTLATTNKQKT